MPITIWSLEAAKKKHRFSPSLARALVEVLPRDTPVLDLGCGIGSYLAHLSSCGYSCLGVEGTKKIGEIADFPEIIEADLAQPLNIDWPRSSIVCLEVAEHLLPEQEPQLLESIDRFCDKWLILSWAIPGQKGHGHNNCQQNDYVKARFGNLGFMFLSNITEQLRGNIDRNTRYFRNTLMAFRRS